MKTILLLAILFSPLLAADEPAPKDWAAWAKWAEKLHPITDAQGHGPDIGSDEWANAIAKRLGVGEQFAEVGQRVAPRLDRCAH